MLRKKIILKFRELGWVAGGVMKKQRDEAQKDQGHAGQHAHSLAAHPPGQSWQR